MYVDGRQPVKYGLKMEIDDRYSQLKEELSSLCGIPTNRLLLAEVASSLIRVRRNWLEYLTNLVSL